MFNGFNILLEVNFVSKRSTTWLIKWFESRTTSLFCFMLNNFLLLLQLWRNIFNFGFVLRTFWATSARFQLVTTFIDEQRWVSVGWLNLVFELLNFLALNNLILLTLLLHILADGTEHLETGFEQFHDLRRLSSWRRSNCNWCDWPSLYRSWFQQVHNLDDLPLLPPQSYCGEASPHTSLSCSWRLLLMLINLDRLQLCFLLQHSSM